MNSLNSNLSGNLSSNLNNMKRRMLALLLVLVVSAFAVTPVFARTGGEPTERIGTAAAVMEKDALRVRVVETTFPTGEVRYSPASSAPQASPLYPMWHYTCYFEGVKIPCSFLAWLWY